MLDYDLHCHSKISDGTMTPTELVNRAAARGVKVMALTDHDDMDGLDEARAAAAQHGMTFINGVEVSVSWRTHTLHIIGLNIAPAYPPLVEGLRSVRSGRGERARKMSDALAKAGIGGVLEGAYHYAGNPNMIGRTHFARYLVEAGHCKDVKSVFNRYLVKGKPGYVPHQWAVLADAISWIRGSGGVAVLAHPGRYMTGRNGMGKKTMQECGFRVRRIGRASVGGRHRKPHSGTVCRVCALCRRIPFALFMRFGFSRPGRELS
jgi:predicted metal-dependent phosphoesterase TrpH